MPVKNAPSKKPKIKAAKAVTKPKDEENDEVEAVAPVKNKFPVEADEPADLESPDEKIGDDDPLLGGDSDDEFGSDDSGLEEELDPFKDNWEE